MPTSGRLRLEGNGNANSEACNARPAPDPEAQRYGCDHVGPLAVMLLRDLKIAFLLGMVILI